MRAASPPLWQEIINRAKPIAPTGATYETLLELDRRFVAQAFHPLTDWWKQQLAIFYQHGKKRFVARVGRGGAKSTTMVMVALNEVLNGAWVVPKGDPTHLFGLISENKEEAQRRLVTLEQRLQALGLAYQTKGDELWLPAMNRGFRVFACTVGAVSGFRCVGFAADELAKWRTADRSANPAAEVIASVRATTVNHPHAHEFMVSSPWGTQDLHYQLMRDGDTENQSVSMAPSWVANPSITEEQTHTLEDNPRNWLREYAAIPAQGIADNWFGHALEVAATSEPAPKHYGTRYHIAIDPAFTRDRFGYAVIASHKDESGQRVTWTHACDSWDPKDMKPSELAARIKTELCIPYGQDRVYSDQYEGASFGEHCQNAGIYLEVHDWTNAKGPKGKLGRFKSVRNAMLDGSFKFPDNPELLKELREHYGIYGDGGRETVNALRTEQGHGDRVSALVLGGSIALEYAAQDVEQEPVRSGTPEWDALEQRRMRDQAITEARKRQKANRIGGLW
jgi:hypothetical protein